MRLTLLIPLLGRSKEYFLGIVSKESLITPPIPSVRRLSYKVVDDRKRAILALRVRHKSAIRVGQIEMASS